MRVSIYVRVSTSMQVEEGYSLDAQVDRCKAYAVSQGWEIITIYVEEGESAKDLNRTEVKRMLSDAEDGLFDVLLVYKLDRLTRSVRDLHKLLDMFERYNIKFRSATEVYDTTSAMGRLFITIVAALAEWERSNLAERVRFGMETLVQEGKWHGGPVPQGYTWDGETMHIVPEEEKVIRELRNVYMAGNGYSATARSMNSRGLFRRGGLSWNQLGIQYVLSNPFYAGKMMYGKKNNKGKYVGKKKEENVEVIWADHNYPQIFTWEEYLEHSERMRRRQFYGNGKKYDYWFTGILRCARCGSGIFGKTKKTVNGRKVLYICSNRKQTSMCNLPIIRQSVIEKIILMHIEQIKLSYNEVSAAIDGDNAQEESIENEIKDCKKQLSLVMERKKKWQYMFAEDLISESDFRERKREDDEIERVIQVQIDELKAKSVGYQSNQIPMLIDLPSLWDKLDDYDKREMMQTIFENIFVDCDVESGMGVSGKGKELPFRITDVIFN